MNDKTDFCKFTDLLDSFGIYYMIENSGGTPPRTLVYLTENFHNLLWIKTGINQPELPENEDDRKVVGYDGFYCHWVFDENGKFEQVGIFE